MRENEKNGWWDPEPSFAVSQQNEELLRLINIDQHHLQNFVKLSAPLPLLRVKLKRVRRPAISGCTSFSVSLLCFH